MKEFCKVQYLLEELEQKYEELSNKITDISCGLLKATKIFPHFLYEKGDIRPEDYIGTEFEFKFYPKLEGISTHDINSKWCYIAKTNADLYPHKILSHFSYIQKSFFPTANVFHIDQIKKACENIEIQENRIYLIGINIGNGLNLLPFIKGNNLNKLIENEINCLEEELNCNSHRAGVYRIDYTKTLNSDGTNLPLSLEDRNRKEEEIRKLKVANKKISELIIELNDDFVFLSQNNQETYNTLKISYENGDEPNKFIEFLLKNSLYGFIFERKIISEYDLKNKNLIIDFLLPNKSETPNQVEKKGNNWIDMPITKFKKNYEEIIYAIVIRSLAEICHYDYLNYLDNICFNGKVKERSPLTGQEEERYILSVNVSRTQIESINLEFIKPKECFKFLKGVSASKLYDTTEIQPIITPEFADKRIIESRRIEIERTSNIAEMDWEDFEHLVRQIFEWEFGDKGGEVKVTQSSRDGGVDAIVFDPDPIRGGKIIIQAKRYTNTVPVSAVRDLYGTIINEGANKGILITTSDYGSDSYKFAQGKPITLLNGGHLLYLLEKHGHHARIDLREAKEKAKSNL